MTLRARAKKLAYLAGLTASVSLASLMISPKANAVTYTLFTDSSSFSPQITELSGTPVLTLHYYTPQAGETLTEVDFTLTATLSSSGNITNNAAQAQTFRVTTALNQFDFTQASDGSGVPVVGFPPNASDIIATQRYTGLAAGATSSFGNGTLVNYTNTASYTNFQQFLGSGTYNLYPYTTIGTNFAGGGGNVGTNIQTYAGATVTVNYIGTKSTPVPFEFSSDSVIIPCAGTLVGISLWKRKRQRAQA